MNLSYATSRSYLVWLASSIFIFIPLNILAAAIIKGPLVTPTYLINMVRKLNFSRTAFLTTKSAVAEAYRRSNRQG